MKIRFGYEIVYDFTQRTPLILNLGAHYSRASDIIEPDYLKTDPVVTVSTYRDSYGNWCTRILAPPGRLKLSANGVIRDAGMPDEIADDEIQHPVEELPSEALLYLLGSRYCETDLLSETAWELFNSCPNGGRKVKAICDFVHNHIRFGYDFANSAKTARDVFLDPRGVCRDYAHLAIAFCRCMNIPARYCSGYLSDVGVPPPYDPMDFAGWFEAYLGGRWHTFDPRNNTARKGRILIAYGRDAADVPITHTFGPNTLVSLRVWTDELTS